MAIRLASSRVCVYSNQTAMPACRGDNPRVRLAEALQSEDAQQASIALKHLFKTLASATLTCPSQLLCGIEQEGGYLHFMCVYRQPDGGDIEQDIALSYSVPIRLDDFI